MSAPDDCIAGRIGVPTSQPIQENGNADGIATAAELQPVAERVCGRCSASNAADADRCTRCQSWLPGNAGAVTTGVYRRNQPTDLRAHADAIIAGLVADRGGLDELSTAERATIRNVGDLAIMLQSIVNNIDAQGLFTAGGNVRQVYAQYLAGVDRFDRLVSRIGLSRRAKRVGNIAEQLADLHR